MKNKKMGYGKVGGSKERMCSYKHTHNGAVHTGNEYTTTWRQYDSRLGRWLSVDPIVDKYPEFSSYISYLNNPIMLTDPRGDDVLLRKWKKSDRKILIRELENITGLDLRVGLFGKLKYAKDSDGNPVVNGNRPNSRPLSTTGQFRLIAMIDDHCETIHVTGKKGESSFANTTEGYEDPSGSYNTFVNIDPQQAANLKAGYHGPSGRNRQEVVTTGMLFFHETDHAYTGSLDEFGIGVPVDIGFGDERSSNGILAGSAASFTNRIRSEMGLKIRATYSIQVGEYKIIPFVNSSSSFSQIQRVLDSFKDGDTKGIGDYIKINSPDQDNSRDYEANPIDND